MATTDEYETLLGVKITPFADEEGQELLLVTWADWRIVTDEERLAFLVDLHTGHAGPRSLAGYEGEQALLDHADTQKEA